MLFHSYLYIHICTLESQSHFSHTLAFEKKPSCHLPNSWGAILHHIFIWEAFLCNFGMSTFFERPLMLPTHKYTYFEMHYLLFIHFARYFNAIYSHIYLHTIEKASPTLLRCKVPIMGQIKSLQKSPYFHAFLHSKPKFKSLGISHASLHWNLKA